MRNSPTSHYSVDAHGIVRDRFGIVVNPVDPADLRAHARRLLAIAAQADPPSTPRLHIEGTWLVREVDHCTCAGGDVASNGAHESHCGLEPELNLSTLPGWPGATDAP